MTNPSEAYIDIEVPPVNNIIVTVPGPQGPPGLQNVFVGPTPPNNPQVNTIWIDTQ